MHEAVLLADLERRHHRKIRGPFVPGDEVLVFDLLTDRSTDKGVSRKLVLDPTTLEWVIKVATYYPDPRGSIERPVGKDKDLSDYTGTQHERLRRIDAQFEISQAFVAVLRAKKLVITGLKNVEQGEYVVNSFHDDYKVFRKTHPDLRYQAAPQAPIHPELKSASCFTL